MAKSLIIVESPAKTKTLKSILGPNFTIEASMGHVRDLPKSTLGVEIENEFTPKYVTIPERREVLKKLKAAAAKADVVYLASDPDREGEAIAWHLEQALKLTSAKRIQFNEITKSAVLRSLEEPRTVNMDLVNAQQGRRVLDRLVGYKLSPLLWRKVKRNLSAGRVQSVAVRLVCDREREILAFVPEEFWNLTAKLTPFDNLEPFDAKLIQKNDKKFDIHKEDDANQVLADLKNSEYAVKKVNKREQRRNAPAPFITSTLQQEASRKLGFSARRTMTVAQQLYEGIDLGEQGTVGLITYMRTDSTRIAAEAIDEARDFILNTYGQEYVPEKPAVYSKKKGAQDAHEAIRPTSAMRRPEMLSKNLDPSQLRLYRLIWQRFIASQMKPAIFDVVSVDIQASDYTFRATGSTMKFQGFTAIYSEGKDDQKIEDEERPPLPVMTEGQGLRLIDLKSEQKFTEPPPRFTEATLVKALEEKGIGRPSTYASIMSTIQDRSYVLLEEKKFKPTDLGLAVTDLLVRSFPDILDIQFTASMEGKLDSVEEGELDWVKLLTDFYPPFEKSLETALEQQERVKIAPKESDEVCPKCGKKMMIRQSRFGQFLGCSGYPECKTILSMTKLNVKCPTCKEGDVVEKKSKKGKVFYGCNRYPECSYVSWDKPIEKLCPKCSTNLSEHRWRGQHTIKCINPECDYEEQVRKKGQEEEEDQALAS